MQGDTGRLIKATLAAAGIDERDVHVVSALNCKPNTAKPKDLRNAVESCRARLLRELRSLGIERVLCLGTLSYTALCKTTVYDKKGRAQNKIDRMDKVHGRWMPVYGMQMIGTYSPTRVLMDTELFRDWWMDFEKFFRGPYCREPWPNIVAHYPQTADELADHLFDMGGLRKKEELSLDIETDGFDHTEDDLLAVGLSNIKDDNSAEVVIIDQMLLQDIRTWRLIAQQLEHGWTSFHNGRFDLKFLIRELRKRGIEYTIGEIDDTMLLNYCRDERPMGRYGAHTLKNISRIRYDAPDYDINMGAWIKKYHEARDKRDWDTVDELIAQMHTYLVMDCYYTARLCRDLRDEVGQESAKLLDFYEWLLIPGSIALTDIEYRGCKVDRPYLEAIGRKLEHKAKLLLEEIQEITGNPNFNPGSSKQMYQYLYVQHHLPVPKTERRGKLQEGPTSRPMLDVLRHRFPEHVPFLDCVIEYRRTDHLRGTYVDGILQRLDREDRIHCSYLQHGTSTGRLSSISPNLQNIPDKSYSGVDIRAAYTGTEDDWSVIEADYSQLELRVAAHCSGDKKLTQVYLDDGDLHDDVSEAVYKRRETSPHERWLVKRLVFGTLYGRGAASLATGPEMEYVETELGGRRWTLQETEVFFKRFLGAYPELKQWLMAQKETAYTDQMVETPFGRRRRFPFIGRNDGGTAGRQGLNTPIQSTASDITFSALIRIHNRLVKINDRVGQIVAHVVLTVHDSITVECRDDYLEQVRQIVDEEMSQVPLKSKVPFKAKIAVGKNWGACK